LLGGAEPSPHHSKINIQSMEIGDHGQAGQAAFSKFGLPDEADAAPSEEAKIKQVHC
jgi:hypothetical protein